MTENTLDRGIWAMWYDLPAEGRDDFLAWLHDTRLPALRDDAAHLWAAHYEIAGGGADMDKIADHLARPEGADEVGTGTQFVILVGAASPHDFFAAGMDPMSGPIGTVPPGVAEPLGKRVCVFAEEDRVAGPAFEQRLPDGTPGPAIQMGSFRTMTVADEFDLAAWYTQYRFPAMAAMGGTIRTRKLVSVAGWAKHSVMYEFLSLEDRAAHFQNHESLALDETVWTNKIINYTVHAPGSPSVAKRVWP